MQKKERFQTAADSILRNHSGWSGVDCLTCGRATTKAQYSYSRRFYGKPLCRTCQSLEKYKADS